MDEIKEAIKERIKNSYYGAFVIAFIILNYKAVFILALGKYDTVEKLDFICSTYVNKQSMLIMPALYSLGYIVAAPWISYAYEMYINKPNYLREMLKLEYDTAILKAQNEKLESQRAAALLQGEIKSVNMEQNKHDIEMFLKLDKMLNEAKLTSTLNKLKHNKECSVDEYKLISSYVQQANMISNKYLNNEFNELHNLYIRALSDLDIFLTNNTTHGLSNTNNLIMQIVNINDKTLDGNMRKELTKLINDVDESYSMYRSEIKTKLEQ